MILSLVAADVSIFNTPCQAFFFLIKLACEAFFVLFTTFNQHVFLATFCLILLHLTIQILRSEIYSFKALRYTCKCNN